MAPRVGLRNAMTGGMALIAIGSGQRARVDPPFAPRSTAGTSEHPPCLRDPCAWHYPHQATRNYGINGDKSLNYLTRLTNDMIGSP
jgi:hypothetical protein